MQNYVRVLNLFDVTIFYKINGPNYTRFFAKDLNRLQNSLEPNTRFTKSRGLLSFMVLFILFVNAQRLSPTNFILNMIV